MDFQVDIYSVSMSELCLAHVTKISVSNLVLFFFLHLSGANKTAAALELC